MVCTPKGKENCLTTNAHIAKNVPIVIILLHLSGNFAMTNAKVVIPLCSGIPCKRKLINEISMAPHPL